MLVVSGRDLADPADLEVPPGSRFGHSQQASAVRGLHTVQPSVLGVYYTFSRGSSQPRDRTQVSCIAGGFFTS